MHWPIEWYIAARYIRSNVRQSIIIALAVGIGVSIIIFIPSVNLSFFDDLLSKTVKDYPHIRVTKELKTETRNEQVLRQQMPANQRLLIQDQTVTRRRNIQAYRRFMQQLLTVPGVVQAAPYITEQVIVVRGAKVMGASLRGIIPQQEREVSGIEDDVMVGHLETLSTNQVFLGWRLADELGVTVGQRVQVVTSQGSFSLKVVGLMKTGIYQQDMDSVIVSLQTAQQLLNMVNEVTGISLKVQDFYQANRIAGAIAKTYNEKQLH